MFSFVPFAFGCSFFQSNKKTKMVEPPSYYQHQHQSQSSQLKNTSTIDESKIFHGTDDETMNVKIFRDTELEKLQRESIEMSKVKNEIEPQTTAQTTTSKSWFPSLFGGNKNNNKQKNSTDNTPYLMSDRARKINSNLQ
ncbi:MAG: hypothetical protein LBL62_10360 [Planctomycetaceae bacterium]|nr:hypothetical protein [Planctomycetaceae bacterium]